MRTKMPGSRASRAASCWPSSSSKAPFSAKLSLIAPGASSWAQNSASPRTNIADFGELQSGVASEAAGEVSLPRIGAPSTTTPQSARTGPLDLQQPGLRPEQCGQQDQHVAGIAEILLAHAGQTDVAGTVVRVAVSVATQPAAGAKFRVPEGQERSMAPPKAGRQLRQ